MEDSRAAAVVAAPRPLNGSASPIPAASPTLYTQQLQHQQQQQSRPREQRGSPTPAARPVVAPELQRAPTWARNINFDDGFDLKAAAPPAPMHDAPIFAPSGVAASPNFTAAARVDASPALAQASPGAPHFRSYSGGDRQDVGMEGPQSAGFVAARNAAFAHPAHARVASTDNFRPAPGKGGVGRPGTGSSTGSSPRLASSGSPQSTQGPASERSTPKAAQTATMGVNGQAGGSNASLPQQPQYMQHQHPLQQTRVPSRSASPEWARVQSYSGSSADLYAAGPTLEQLGSYDVASAGGSRSGGSMSGDDDGQRGEYGYANGNPKRGSVLSFQTAMSGSFASATGTASSQDHVRSDAIDVHRAANEGQGPYGTSPEDAIPGALPGGWGGRGWAPTPPPKPDSATSSPRARLTPIDAALASKQLPEQPYADPRTPVARKVSIPLSAEAALALPPHGSDAPTQDLDDTVLLPGAPGIQREVTITPAHTRSASKQSQHLPPLPQGPAVQEILPVAAASPPPPPVREASTMAQEASTAPSKPPVDAPPATPRESTSTSNSTAVFPPSSSPQPPALPEKELSPRVPTKDIFPAPHAHAPLMPSAEVTLPSDEPSPGLLEDNVIPPPLPAGSADIARPGDFARVPSTAPEPVSDFRARPLADVQATSPVAPAQLQAVNTSAGVAGLGTQQHTSPVEVASPVMRGPAGGGVVRAALAEAPAAPAASRSDEESVETPPREDSPPPEGEVEARAEWERAQAKQIAGASADAAAAGRKSFRGSLKPLQYVSSSDARDGAQALFTPGYAVDANGTPAETPKSEQGNPLLTAVGAPAQAQRRGSSGQLLDEGKAQQGKGRSGSGVMSTQQLQRLQARDQRRSVGAINMTMGAADVAGGSNGPYPAFPSPSTSATKAGTGRQYPGTLPQRSLVAPFELQQRPDGLLSGLIGPDGVRRSPNDPEVCLECMMRDEDMIDVHVLGPGLWERESDRGFEDACQIEREEDERKARDHEAKQPPSSGAHTVESSNGLQPGSDATHPRDSIPMPPRPTGTRIRVKRVAHGDPLTAERLKLHTQMNPPASSHRWRTLQTFLAIQAKYIAMEQRARAAAGLERELPSRPTPAPVVTPSDYDNRMVRTGSDSGPVEGLVSKLSTKNRGQRSSTSLLKDAGFHLEEENLAPADREAKERDIAHAREARRKVASANSGLEIAAAASRASYIASSPAPSPIGGKYPTALDDEPRRTLSTPLKEEDAASLQSSQRRSMAPTPTLRAGSTQDARSTQGALHSTLPNDPSSPTSLVPPSRPFAPSTGGSVNRAAASSLSLAPSGSMIDMHVGMEDRNEHRISQAGFMPGSPLVPASPGTMNRAYYGFPGDGEADDSAVLPMVDSSVIGRYSHPDERDESRDVSLRETSSQKKKKGLRGFFSKITGGNNRRSGSQGFTPDNGSRGDESSKVSQSSLTGSPRAKRSSLAAAQNSLDMQPPPGTPAYASVRTRQSESSLGAAPQPSLEEEDETPEDAAPYLRSPGMISQTSFEDMAPAISGDMGPFQSGPTIAPRTESRLPPAPTPAQPPRAPSRQQDARGLRGASSASYLTNKSRPISGGVLPVVSSNGPAFVAPNHLPKRTTSRGGSASGPPGIPRMGSVTGLDGQARAPAMNGDFSNTPGDRASVASRVSRKEPPSMPGMAAHSRGSSAGTGATPSDSRYASGYSSATSPLTSSLPGFEAQQQQQQQPQQRQSMQPKHRMPPPPLILEPYTRPITPSGPARPPRSPRRSDMALGDSDAPPPVPPHQSMTMAMRSQTPTQQMQQPAHHFHTSPRLQNMASTGAMAGAFQNSPPPREGTPQRQNYALDLATPVKDKASRKSRFLSRFTFKWTKRDAAKLPPTPRVGDAAPADVPLGFDGKPRVIPAYTTKAAKQPPRAVDDLAGLAPPRFNFGDRARAVSTPNDDRLPPRSQSAMGMLPSQGFRSNFPGFRSRSRAAMLDEDSDE